MWWFFRHINMRHIAKVSWKSVTKQNVTTSLDTTQMLRELRLLHFTPVKLAGFSMEKPARCISALLKCSKCCVYFAKHCHGNAASVSQCLMGYIGVLMTVSLCTTFSGALWDGGTCIISYITCTVSRGHSGTQCWCRHISSSQERRQTLPLSQLWPLASFSTLWMIEMGTDKDTCWSPAVDKPSRLLLNSLFMGCDECRR